MRAEIQLLGSFQVIMDGEHVPPDAWRRRDPAALVKLLALSPGHRLHRERLVDALWPDLLLPQALPRLHKAAQYARTALGAPNGVVLTDGAVALLPGADLWVDTDAFDDAVTKVRSGHLEAIDDVVEMYAGDLLPDDPYEPWAEEPRDERRVHYLEVLRTSGRWELVLAADPYDEEAHLQLVADHLERGDRRSAVAQLDRLDHNLDELGLEPSVVAAELRDRALSLPFTNLRSEVRASRRAPVPRPTTPTIGRDREVAELAELLERVQVVTLLGPGGVGKTRVAIEAALGWTTAHAVEACFVDRTRATDADAVPDLIARSLGVNVPTPGRAEVALEEALSGRTMLLVLERPNVVHVFAGDPQTCPTGAQDPKLGGGRRGPPRH